MQHDAPPVLSFLHLWDSWEALAELEKNSKHTTSVFANFFREQCNSAATSAKVFSRQALSSLGHGELGSFQNFLFAFKGLSETFAANHEIIANSMNEVARKPCDSLQNYLQTNHQRLSSESERLQKELAQLSEAADRARQRCERAYRECEQARLASQAAYEPVVAKRAGADEEGARRLRDRYHALQRELSAADAQYVAAVKAARTQRVAYDARISQLLAAYEQIETTRQARTVKMARHFLQAQEAMLVSLQRNVRSVMAVLDEVQPERDVQAFIAQHATHTAIPPLPAYVNYGGSGLASSTADQIAALYAPPKEEEKSDELRDAEAVFRESADALFWSARKEAHEENARRVVAASLPERGSQQPTPPTLTDAAPAIGGGVAEFDAPPRLVAPAEHPYELQSDCLNAMTALLRTPHGRSAFSTVLNQRRAVTGLPARAFDTLEYLVKIFLDEAHAAQHTQPAKVVMILSQTFHRRTDAAPLPVVDSAPAPFVAAAATAAAPAPREYMHARVFHHPMWRDLRFWRESFFDSVRVELCKHEAPQKWHTDDEQAEANSRTKQCVFSHLAAVSFNMKEFALDAGERRAFIESMSAIYELDAASLDMLLAIAGAPIENSY